MATSYTITAADDATNKAFSEFIRDDVMNGTPLIGMLSQEGVLTDDYLPTGNEKTYQRAGRATSAGVLGDGAKRPSASSVNYFTDKARVDSLAFLAVSRTQGSMAQQNVSFDLDESAINAVSNQFKDVMEAGFAKNIAGELATAISYDGVAYTGDTRRVITGVGQLPTLATSTRILRANSLTTDEAVQADTTAVFNLDDVDRIRVTMQTQVGGVLNPVKLSSRKDRFGMEYNWVMLVAQSAVNQMLRTTTANKLTLTNTLLSRIQGGDMTAQQMVTYGFVYNGVKIVPVSDHYIPNGINSSTSATQGNVRRAVFLGSDAVVRLMGEGYKSMSGDSVKGFKLVTDADTIENANTIKVEGCFGIKKRVFNSVDFGVYVYSHYVA
jgi:hypothetical protein